MVKSRWWKGVDKSTHSFNCYWKESRSSGRKWDALKEITTTGRSSTCSRTILQVVSSFIYSKMQRFRDDRSALSIRGGRCFVINIMFPTDQTSHFYRHLRCCCCDCDCSSSFHPRCAALVHRHIVFAVLWRSTDETTLNDVVGANRERETAATIEPQAHESVPIYTKPLPNSLKLGIRIANNNVPFCHPKPNNGIHDQHCSGLWSGIWIPVWCGALIRKYSLEHGHETKHDGQRTCELLMHLELNKSGIREF